jgi:hypothetical protein
MAMSLQIHGYGDAIQKGTASGRLIRIWLIAIMLCCLPITDFGVQVQAGVRGESIKQRTFEH